MFSPKRSYNKNDTFSLIKFLKRSKIKFVSFSLWPNIFAFICEGGIIYLINIYSDEIFQEINLSPLQPSKILFFYNEKSFKIFFSTLLNS